jgi:hypothetical protein
MIPVSIVSLCEELGRRTQDAATRGEATFPIPESTESAEWAARSAPTSDLRSEATTWRASGASYHALVRLCFRTALALDELSSPHGGSLYRNKVQRELEPMLALWPSVIVLPIASALTPLDMIRLRAFPVHPLGLTHDASWADGAVVPPSEFFFHDLDHARFKIREDLQVEGIDVPDAYHAGTTIDPESGEHRTFLEFARGLIGDRLWARAVSRTALAERLIACLTSLGSGPRGKAAELLLFEIVHEKSFPLDRTVLNREFDEEAHLVKLRKKAASRFFPSAIDYALVDALPLARASLKEALG